MIKIPKTLLVSHLESRIRCNVGGKGLQILIYGWLNFRKYGDRYRHAVKTRKNDLAHIADDQEAFLAQRDQADGKKTMLAYLWAICGAEYDAQHNG